MHIDIKYLPPVHDETARRYLFVAIDRATRWVFLHVYGDMTDRDSVDFLRWLKLASPIKVTKILTDNGSQFTDRFTTTDNKPSGQHAFDKSVPAWPSNIAWYRRMQVSHLKLAAKAGCFSCARELARTASRADLGEAAELARVREREPGAELGIAGYLDRAIDARADRL